MRERDYAFEALVEVTASNPDVARGALNVALRDIKAQEPDLTDSFFLAAEIHERAKMYRAVFSNAALTPNALAKHWQRVKAETHKRPRIGKPPSLPPLQQERLTEARKLMATLWPESSTQ